MRGCLVAVLMNAGYLFLAGTMLPLAHSSSRLEAVDVTRDRDHCRGLLPHIVVAHWFAETTFPAIHGLDALVKRAAHRHPEGVCLIQVVSPGAAMPSGEARSELASLLRSRASALLGSAVVMPGEGFRVAAARAVVTGLAMLVRPPFPHVVHASVLESAGWFAELLRPKGVTLVPGAVARAIDALGQSPVSTK